MTNFDKVNDSLPEWLKIDENAKYEGDDIDADIKRLYIENKKIEDELPNFMKEPVEDFDVWCNRTDKEIENIRIIERMTKKTSLDIIDTPPDLYTWGTEELDKSFPPIERHHLIVLTAKAGSGKSTYTFDLAEKNTLLGKRVLYISLEMTVSGFINTKARQTAGISIEQWRNRNFSERQIDTYIQTKARIHDNRKLIFGSFEKTDINKTCDNIQKMIDSVGPDLVIIDNFGLIEKEKYEKDLDSEQRISKYFMDFTNNNKIPVILIHHTNKQGEMRGSQKIEDNCDIHIFMKRKEFDENSFEDDKRATMISIKKDRDWGQCCLKTIYFDSGTFSDNFKFKQNYND